MRPQRLARQHAGPGRDQVVVLAVRAKQGANQDGLGRTKADFSVRASRCLAGGSARQPAPTRKRSLVQVQCRPPALPLVRVNYSVEIRVRLAELSTLTAVPTAYSPRVLVEDRIHGAKHFHTSLRQLERPAGPGRLGISPTTNRPPHPQGAERHVISSLGRRRLVAYLCIDAGLPFRSR
jgi:hypothetical protein